jgi:hypothetical protein
MPIKHLFFNNQMGKSGICILEEGEISIDSNCFMAESFASREAFGRTIWNSGRYCAIAVLAVLGLSWQNSVLTSPLRFRLSPPYAILLTTGFPHVIL